jgi:hypothetical protein
MRGLMLFAVAVIAVCVPEVVHARALTAHYVPPSRLVLRLTDMPTGFIQTGKQSVNDAQADKGDGFPAGTVERHGRIAGTEVDFQHSGLFGLLGVQCTVLVFRSISGATWQNHLSDRQTRKSFRGAHFIPMSVGRIGNEATGYQWTGKSKGIKITLFVVLFRRGTYVGEVLGDGLPNAVDPDTVIRLAHVVDNRIVHAR